MVHLLRSTNLQPARDPQRVIELLSEPGSDSLKKMWRPGFDHFMKEMPRIDATKPNQDREVQKTAEVLSRMADAVQRKLNQMNIPDIGPGQFGRIILAIEEPKHVDGKLIPGTEVVLAIWGRGFSSPVHGHAAGYLHEQLIQGAFDVHLFEAIGDHRERKAVYTRTIQQDEPGIFYSQYQQERGQEKRSDVIHNFVARNLTFSLHYLPEHVRNGVENMFSVVNTERSGAVPSGFETLPFKPGFTLSDTDYERVTPTQMSEGFKVGDTLLARSKSVPFLGPHYAVITSETLIQKPHGLRPPEVSIRIPHDVGTPLDQFGAEETMVLLKLRESARDRLHRHYGIEL